MTDIKMKFIVDIVKETRDGANDKSKIYFDTVFMSALRSIAKERYSLSFLLFLFFSNVYRGSSEILLAFEHVALLERNENSPGESTREAFYLLKYSRGEIK